MSISTVSHVINQTRPVSDRTRLRVLAAMDALGYKPNALARNLRRQKTNSIGMILPDSTNPFFAEVARGIEDASFARNYSVILCNSDGDLEKQLTYTDVLIENKVAGIVFVAAGVSPDLVEELDRRRVPLVVVDRAVPGVEIDTVMTDHAQGGRQATRHLLDLGHRRIACITGGSRLSPSSERVTGYREALQEAGVAFDPGLVLRGDFHFDSGYQATLKLLASDHPPSAIFACNDLMAVGCIHAAAEVGCQVPTDLSVVGFDDVRLASYTTPALTSVAQPKHEIGALALKLLLDRIREPEAPSQHRRLATTLVIRGSTASPPAG